MPGDICHTSNAPTSQYESASEYEITIVGNYYNWNFSENSSIWWGNASLSSVLRGMLILHQYLLYHIGRDDILTFVPGVSEMIRCLWDNGFSNDIFIFPRWNPGVIQVQSKCNPGAIQVQFMCNPGAVKVGSRCNPSVIQVQSRWNPGKIQVWSWWNPGGLQMKSRCNRGAILGICI